LENFLLLLTIGESPSWLCSYCLSKCAYSSR